MLAYLLATASTMHYIYDVMLGGGLFVSGNNRGDLGVLLGCVVRVESIG